MSYLDDPTRGLNEAVAATLNGERVASGLTFDQLASKASISKRQLLRLISTGSKDRRHIDVAALDAISSALGVAPADVFAAAVKRLERDKVETPARQAATRGVRKSGVKESLKPPGVSPVTKAKRSG